MKSVILGIMFFFDGVENITDKCSSNPTPSRYDTVCANFLSTTSYKFKDHLNSGKEWGRDGIDEVHLLHISEESKRVFLTLCKCYNLNLS